MVQVKDGSKLIKHKSGTGKFGRDSYDITLRWSRADIKKFLQEHLIELRDYDIPNRFTDAEIVELFKTRLFALVPPKAAEEMANWAFNVALKMKYFTTNRWDKDSQTIYFIDKVILTMRPGRKGKKQAKDFEKFKEEEL